MYVFVTCVHAHAYRSWRLGSDVFLYHSQTYLLRQGFSQNPELINWLACQPWGSACPHPPTARGKDALDPLDFCVGAEDLNCGPRACATGTLSAEYLPRPWSTFNNTHWPLAFHVWELSTSLAHSTVWGVDCISFYILGINNLAEARLAKTLPPFCSHLLTLLRASSAMRNVWASCSPTS